MSKEKIDPSAKLLGSSLAHCIAGNNLPQAMEEQPTAHNLSIAKEISTLKITEYHRLLSGFIEFLPRVFKHSESILHIAKFLDLMKGVNIDGIECREANRILDQYSGLILELQDVHSWYWHAYIQKSYDSVPVSEKTKREFFFPMPDSKADKVTVNDSTSICTIY
ncbi:MAG: hypothetical protein M3R00_00195 [Pseudomonadota bacterium]|nr:hypothetical protein [Pseudomonadota bacterium]